LKGAPLNSHETDQQHGCLNSGLFKLVFANFGFHRGREPFGGFCLLKLNLRGVGEVHVLFLGGRVTYHLFECLKIMGFCPPSCFSCDVWFYKEERLKYNKPCLSVFCAHLPVFVVFLTCGFGKEKSEAFEKTRILCEHVKKRGRSDVEPSRGDPEFRRKIEWSLSN